MFYLESCQVNNILGTFFYLSVLQKWAGYAGIDLPYSCFPKSKTTSPRGSFFSAGPAMSNRTSYILTEL
jgi:hypothetical protein